MNPENVAYPPIIIKPGILRRFSIARTLFLRHETRRRTLVKAPLPQTNQICSDHRRDGQKAGASCSIQGVSGMCQA